VARLSPFPNACSFSKTGLLPNIMGTFRPPARLFLNAQVFRKYYFSLRFVKRFLGKLISFFRVFCAWFYAAFASISCATTHTGARFSKISLSEVFFQQDTRPASHYNLFLFLYIVKRFLKICRKSEFQFVTSIFP
jgi:hypothetical protein